MSRPKDCSHRFGFASPIVSLDAADDDAIDRADELFRLQLELVTEKWYDAPGLNHMRIGAVLEPSTTAPVLYPTAHFADRLPDPIIPHYLWSKPERGVTMDEPMAGNDDGPAKSFGEFLITELRSNQCRFPVSGDDGAYLFCGRPSEPGVSYCACHAKKCHAKPARRRTRSHHDLDYRHPSPDPKGPGG